MSDIGNITLRFSVSRLLLQESLRPNLVQQLQSALVTEEYFTFSVIFKNILEGYRAAGFSPETRGENDAFLVDTIREEHGSSQVVKKEMTAQ